MRLNIEEYENAYKTLDTEMRNDLFEIFKFREEKIKSIVEIAITENLGSYSNIPDLNEFVQDNLMEPLYQEQMRLSDAVTQKVDTIMSYTKNLIESQGATRGKSWFNTLRNELTRSVSTYEIEQILSDFLARINRFLEVRLVRIDENILFNIRTMIKASIKPTLYEACAQVQDALKNRINEFVAKFNIITENDITVTDVNCMREAAGYLGYEISHDDKKQTHLVNKDSKLLLVKQTDGSIVSTDKDITFSTVSSNRVVVNHGKDVLVVDSTFISFGPEADPFNMRIDQGFMDYTFSCAGKKLDDPLQIDIILSTIKRNYKNMYDKLANDPMFKEVIEKCESAKKSSQKIIKDENGITHLNTNTLEELKSYLEVIGYTPIEKEDGVYLVNASGEEQKISYREGAIILPSEEQIAIDFHIVGLAGIKGPDIYYKDRSNEKTLFYAEDFSQIDLIVPEGHFRVMAGANGVHYHSMIGDSVEKNEELVTEMFNKHAPSLLAKLKMDYIPDYEGSITADLLSELNEEQTAEIVTDNKEVYEQVNIDERLEELMQDPNVLEYIRLKQEQELNQTEQIRKM